MDDRESILTLLKILEAAKQDPNLALEIVKYKPLFEKMAKEDDVASPTLPSVALEQNAIDKRKTP